MPVSQEALEAYVADRSEDIASTIEAVGCQPILFVGSGLSLRYLDAPNWLELLRILHEACPIIDKPFAYYLQQHKDDYPAIGSEFSRCFREWAWGSGRNNFPDELFEEGVSPDAYIKHYIAHFIKELVSSGISSALNNEEVKALREIRPHAVITTNYDDALERIFPQHEPIVRQKILKTRPEFYGEIMKIHGCVSKFNSLMFTSEDYEDYNIKHKYLSAKLLTYFAEHPLFFVGYSASDPNIRQILSDIDEIVSEDGGEIENIFIILWKEDLEPSDLRGGEQAIDIGSKIVTVRKVVASKFDWVFKAIGSKRPINDVNPRLLRTLLARNYKLVRDDIPQSSIPIDFSMLERAAQNDTELAKVYGIGDVSHAAQINITHPFSLTAVARQLGYKGWHKANDLIKKVESETGINIKATDNRYHVEIRSETATQARHYSAEAVDLLDKVKRGENYEVTL